MKPFSMGITLDSLDVFTTDEDGRKTFLDRTSSANKFKPMYKRLKLENLAVYWNHNDEGKSLIAKTREGTVKGLLSTIYSKNNEAQGFINDFNYMLKISIAIKLI